MTETFMRWLRETNGYHFPLALPGGRYTALNVRMHNTQIIVGKIGDHAGFDDAW